MKHLKTEKAEFPIEGKFYPLIDYKFKQIPLATLNITSNKK